MRGRVCGGLMEARVTDVPFKIGDSAIVLKALPVLQCKPCGEAELEQETMRRVDELPALVDQSVELEVTPKNRDAAGRRPAPRGHLIWDRR